MSAYNVGSTGIDDTTAGAHIQQPVAWLKLKGLKAGSMHVWSGDVEVQLLQPDGRVCEGFVLLLLWHKHVSWAGAHGLDGRISAAQQPWVILSIDTSLVCCCHCNSLGAPQHLYRQY